MRPSRTIKAPLRYGRDDTSVAKSKRIKKSMDPLKPVGYASRLSEYDNYGDCGGDEKPDSEAELNVKYVELAKLIRAAPHVVVHTGAGISTSAGIPDFRGFKHGVWTRHLKGEPLPASERCWNNAQPTYGHMALAKMVELDMIQMIITQNIDGLHRRSNVPEDKLAEVHGNIFREKCLKCKHVTTRSFDCGGVGFKHTGRSCACGGDMIDQLLDWESLIPPDDMKKALDHTRLTEVPNGLAICLGTSMQMTPARDWPCQASKLVIVNLQPTIRDDNACLVIREKIDIVMKRLIQELNKTQKIPIQIPSFYRSESFVIKHEILKEGRFKLTVSDTMGAPCGFILNIHILQENLEEGILIEQQPFVYQGVIGVNDELTIKVKISFDRVPIDGTNFHQPEEQVIEYKVTEGDSSSTYSVVLSPS